ncbi:MAG: guanylate kinase [Eubacteriales bacterium]|jgi:guanylate kinase|nr:guanylate kinase [Eubacteriales bacterium]MDD4104381.1 guanylate kinase [Eubacteriales bacterium]MDD4709672.1 guanylate kinase [Eubacteriales bacterium]NLO16499.1 guanylate kinase [Clostridiales bacterium]
MKETRKGMLIVVSGPSGTGKGTLCEKLLANDTSVRFSVSATTRSQREGEIDGIHYHFMSDERFDELLKQDAFLEHATVHGHRYGTLTKPIDEGIEKGQNILLDIDSQGAINVMKRRPDCVSIFILPPSGNALRVRLHTRNTDDPAEIRRRLANAPGEVAKLKLYDYVVINDDLEMAYEQIYHIVQAEKQKTCRYFPVIEDL